MCFVGVPVDIVLKALMDHRHRAQLQRVQLLHVPESALRSEWDRLPEDLKTLRACRDAGYVFKVVSIVTDMMQNMTVPHFLDETSVRLCARTPRLIVTSDVPAGRQASFFLSGLQMSVQGFGCKGVGHVSVDGRDLGDKGALHLWLVMRRV